MIVDCAVYQNGARLTGEVDVVEALKSCRGGSDGFVWIGLVEPDMGEFDDVSREFDLHPLAVEDAVHAQQRPKLEQYGDTLFVVVKVAEYQDENEMVRLSQLMIFLGENFLVTVRHGPTTVLAGIRHELEADPGRLALGPVGVLHAVVDRVVDNYGTVLRSLEQDVDQVEEAVFSGDRGNLAARIYKVKREVLEFHHAVSPLVEPVEALAIGRVLPADHPMREYFRDVHDHVLRVSERVAALDNLLTSALSANLAQVGVRQNEDMRKISSWVAIVAVPTMIAGVYGMNFEHVPELGWAYGYPFALSLMAVACLSLYLLFKRRGWL